MGDPDDDRVYQRVSLLAEWRVFSGIICVIAGVIGFFVTWNPVALLLVGGGAFSILYWNPVRKKFEQRRDPRNEDFNQP